MKAKFIFDLSDTDERLEFDRCAQSTEMALALFKMRELIIRNDAITNEEFTEILNDYNINLDNLI